MLPDFMLGRENQLGQTRSAPRFMFKINISERLAVVSYAPAPPQTVMKIVKTL